LLDGSWEERPWLAGGPLRSRIEHFIAASLGLDENGDMLSEDEIAFPLPNVWLGVSAEDQKTADERIPLLLQTPAAVRWVSYEPALGPVDFQLNRHYLKGVTNYRPALDWVVCGGESGPSARPMHPDWARSVRGQCVATGVSFFFKQWGSHRPIGNTAPDGTLVDFVGMAKCDKHMAGRRLDGREWDEYPSPDRIGGFVKRDRRLIR
jgi:protein gp37